MSYETPRVSAVDDGVVSPGIVVDVALYLFNYSILYLYNAVITMEY